MSSAKRNSPLWTRLSEADTQQKANVNALVDYAEPLLDLIRDTFPTYTLHNHTHAENVIGLMEDLLGERIEDVRPLEAAILILSAYFHDIGMVYSADERDNLLSQPGFDEFLEKHPHHRLALSAADNQPTETLTEAYCRWRHADRVRAFLDDPSLARSLKWGVTPLTNTLADVCRSHNWTTDQLVTKNFNTDFGSGCDLLFCALILRVADILDFDNSRSPESVYQYLGIGTRETRRSQESDVEWRRHLASEGFVFPEDRPSRYTIKLVAAPDDPAVESDLHEFLRTIESELRATQSLVRLCSSRWSTFVFPEHVDTSSIISDGYTFGDFRFHLDRQSILDLFMGENLYDDKLVFLRELIQNSFDAINSRALLANNGTIDPEWAVHLSTWNDDSGYQWIRIDDDGLGMNQHVVEKYLLRIGDSYYSSEEYRAELLSSGAMNSAQEPIGRFGVGLLSCFLVADRVEVSTLRIRRFNNQEEALRVSFDGLANFAVVRRQSTDAATPFPVRPGTDSDVYRSSPGTTIALRIEPRKYAETIDLERSARRIILGAQVRVMVNDETVADADQTRERLARIPRTPTHPIRWRSTADFGVIPPELPTSVKNKLDGFKFSTLQVDFSANPSQNPYGINGIGTCYLITPSKGYIKAAQTKRGVLAGSYFEMHWRRSHLSDWEIQVGSVRSSFAAAGSFPGESIDGDCEFNPSEWSFSGVRLPTELLDMARTSRYSLIEPNNQSWARFEAPLSSPLTTTEPRQSAHGFVCASFWLSGTDRPDLNIARSKIVSVPFRLAVAIAHKCSQIIELARSEWNLDTPSMINISATEPTNNSLSESLSDPLLIKRDVWGTLPAVGTNRGTISIDEIRSYVAESEQVVVGRDDLWLVSVSRYGPRYHIDWLTEALVGVNLGVCVNTNGAIEVTASAPRRYTDEEHLCPPLTFAPYADPETLVYIANSRPPINVSHSFVQWFFEVSPSLRKRAPRLAEKFYSTLRTHASIRGILENYGQHPEKSREVLNQELVQNMFDDLLSLAKDIERNLPPEARIPFPELGPSCIKVLDHFNTDDQAAQDPT